MTKARLNYFAAAPDAMKGMLDLEKAVKTIGLEPSLVELVKIRASQINGCSYCIYMHTPPGAFQ
jgi:alkylhydroperoxidase family enzyme